MMAQVKCYQLLNVDSTKCVRRSDKNLRKSPVAIILCPICSVHMDTDSICNPRLVVTTFMIKTRQVSADKCV